MLLVTRTLPYLLLEDFCDKALSVGDMYVGGFFLSKNIHQGICFINRTHK